MACALPVVSCGRTSASPRHAVGIEIEVSVHEHVAEAAESLEANPQAFANDAA